jgi:hypothetical protein
MPRVKGLGREAPIAADRERHLRPERQASATARLRIRALADVESHSAGPLWWMLAELAIAERLS